MAIKALKGLTVKIGGDTTELTKSLDKVEKQSRDLSSELGQINKLLKLDPKNTELLAQKQKVLTDAISNTKEKLDTLREAEKQVQAQFERGEVSEAQYRALQREIIETERKLGGYEKAARETAEAVEELGKESKETAEEIEKQERAAEASEQALDDMGGTAADVAKGGLTALVGAATAVVGSIVAMAESSREYRTEMGKLNTAFQEAGHTSEAAKETYKTLQGVLGETEQAVEAANHLAKLCSTEEELAAMTEAAIGIYATFGASLPIEGLTEAANETAKVGQVTGPLADALNWAGESEDKFNEALEKCSSEQERQQLITKTLTKLYGSAAAQYKKTNKEVIRANEATEKWNEATAGMGATVEPLVTDVKELGVALLKNAEAPLKKLTRYIRSTVLPSLLKAGNWVKQNLPKIAALIAGVTAAVLTYKAAVVVAELATKGVTIATLAQAAAQKALNLVMAASPWGLVATAVAGVTAALVALHFASKDAEKTADTLTAEERELMAAADGAAAAFRDQQKATKEALGQITGQMGHVQNLADELRGLADASGKVKDKDQERAQFILNELNEALGTEYTMVDGVIQKYEELTTSINEVIKAKLANSLIEAANADYVAAIQGQAEALENLNLKEQDYQTQLGITGEKEIAALQARNNAIQAIKNNNPIAATYFQQVWASAQEAYEKEKAVLDEKKTAYYQAAADYGSYYNTIANYEEAQSAVLQGNYQKAVDILARKGGAYNTYSEKVDKETANVLDTLYKEALDAGLEAERTKKNFENGVDGYTKEMVTEANKGYEDALKEFATAYADAEGVGEDLGDGLSGGMENKRSGLLAKARSLVTGIISAMREEADSNSPAKKTIDFGEDVGEGAEIGIERKTPDVKRAATHQAAAILDAYSAQEVAGQRALRNVAGQQAARQTASQMTAATANSGMLDKILTAIEKGQVLMLDGDAVVGGTANRMDSALGQRRILASRGAI